MPDFFNNLLLRSSASAKTSGAILQPRLPSLFESTSGVDEIPSPRADGVPRESVSSPREENNPPAFEHSTNNDDEPAAAQPSTVTALPSAQRLEPQPGSKRRSAADPAAEVPEKDSEPGAAAPLPERPSGPVNMLSPGQQAKAPDPTVRTTQETGWQAPLPGAQLPSPVGAPPAQTVEPGRTVLAPVPAPVRLQSDLPDPSIKPPAKTQRARAPQENGQKPQVEARAVDTHALSRVERLDRSDMENHPPANTVRSRPDAGPSAPVLHPVPAPQPAPVASRPGNALFAQAGQEQESVVQIHIGRIEVRAVTPPSAPRTVQATPSQPGMSLADYLRQREEKK